MTVIENNYVGDGSTKIYDFTFPYLDKSHVKVQVDGVDVTAFSLLSPTQIEFTVAPSNGALIRIYRVTDTGSLEATFQPGSAIRAQDLNSNFKQTLYASQESNGRGVNTDNNYVIQGYWTFTRPLSIADPLDNDDAVNKGYVDQLVANGVSDGDKGDILVSGAGGVWTIKPEAKLTDGNKGDITVSSGGTVWTLNTSYVPLDISTLPPLP